MTFAKSDQYIATFSSHCWWFLPWTGSWLLMINLYRHNCLSVKQKPSLHPRAGAHRWAYRLKMLRIWMCCWARAMGFLDLQSFHFFCWKLQKCKNTKMRKCAPQWPFRTREMVPTHPPGCVLTWSNLDPRRSAISEPPGQLMATRGPFMAIWTVFGHKMGKNGWIKSMSIWIKTLLNPTDNLHSLVFTKRQLRNSPPP